MSHAVDPQRLNARTVISQASEGISTQAQLTNVLRLAEVNTGRSRPPRRLDTYDFCRLRCKSVAQTIETGLHLGAGVSRRRACETHTSTMNENICIRAAEEGVEQPDPDEEHLLFENTAWKHQQLDEPIDAGVPGVPAADLPQPGRLFGRFGRSPSCFCGASRLSRLNSKLSRVRARVCTHTPVIGSANSRDSRDTRGEKHENDGLRTSPGVEGVHPPAGTPRDTPGHPTGEVFAQ